MRDEVQRQLFGNRQHLRWSRSTHNPTHVAQTWSGSHNMMMLRRAVYLEERKHSRGFYMCAKQVGMEEPEQTAIQTAPKSSVPLP